MIRIITIGKVKTPYLKEACNDFIGRIKRFSKIEIIEVKESDKKREGEKILELVKDEKFIALDVTGKQYSSEEFSVLINNSQKNNQEIIFVIGNFDGLNEKVLTKSSLKFSLSKLTFTHEQSLFLLLEQIYRGFTIIKNLPYHK